MLLGLRRVVCYVPNLKKAKEWYNKALGIEPYFDKPFYVKYNIGGYNLSLHLNEAVRAKEKERGTIAYWGVENIKGELKHFLELGASLRFDVQDVGEGILLATVFDPFGNILGLIENPDFKPS